MRPHAVGPQQLTIALIDGDMLIYQSAYASQTKVDFGDGDGETLLADPSLAVRNATHLLREWTRKSGASRAIVCLSSVKSDSFRHKLWPAYKANRTGEKPATYAAIREALEFDNEIYAEPGLEADDLMGIAATSDKAQCVIVSRDKDMRTIPTLVFNPAKDQRPVRITRGQADDNWMRQTMIGDAVDGYPGIPKVGEKTADAIIAFPRRLRKQTTMVGKRAPKPVTKLVEGEGCTLWEAMVDRAVAAGMTEDELIVQAQVARILRSGDYDPKTRTVRLWMPGGKHKEITI